MAAGSRVVAHRTRTKLEAAICAEMKRQGLAHAHRILHYRVCMKSGKAAKYEPAIVVHRGAILFLVEPHTSAAATERSLRFLEQHSPEIVYVAVAPKRIAARLPPEAYDELFEDGDLASLVRRIRKQDPEGAVGIFPKRRDPVTESS